MKNYIKKGTIIQAIYYTPDRIQDLLDIGAIIQQDDILVIDTELGSMNIYPKQYVIIEDEKIIQVLPKLEFEKLYDRFDEVGNKRFIRSIK